MDLEKKGSDCVVRGFVKSFGKQSRLKSQDSSKLVSLIVDNLTATFPEGSKLVGTKLSPYVCLKIGSEKPLSQNTSYTKKEVSNEVAWDQALTFPNIKEGTSYLEVQLHDHHNLHRDILLGTGSDTFVTTEDLNTTSVRLTDVHQKHVGDICFRANLMTFRKSSSEVPGLSEKALLAEGLAPAKRGLESDTEQAASGAMKKQIFLETNWKTQYASLACQLVLKAPVSVAVISSHMDTADVVRQLNGLADTSKVKLHAIPCQQSASMTHKGKEKRLSVKKFIVDKELTAGHFDAWIYVMGPHVEPGSKDKEASHELKHDRALLKGLLKRSRLPLTIIHSLPTLDSVACKKALRITKVDSNATVFRLPPEGSSAQSGPGKPLDPLGCYLHPWASPTEAVKATVPCLHAKVAMNMLVRREVDRQLRRHRNPKATTVLWVGVSHTGLGILVPLQPYIGIPLLIAESFTRMFYHVLHVAHTAGIIYNLEEAWATLKGAITKKELESLKRNPKLTKSALKDAAAEGGKAGLEGAAEAVFVEIGVIITKKLASTGAKQVLEQASAGIASQVVGYVIPAIGALLTVAMLPHTYHKIHQMVTCMAYTYHENWAFTSSLPLPMVYEALTMTQPDLAAHLHKAMQLEEEDESSEDLITTQWQTPPQYGESLALQAPTAGDPLVERRVSMGAVSIHGGEAKAVDGDNEVIDFDTLFCYKRQDVSQQQLENLEMGGGPAPELMQELQGQAVETIQAADGTRVATWPFSSTSQNAEGFGGTGMSFSQVIGDPPPPEDAFHPEAHIPWLLSASSSSKTEDSSPESVTPMQLSGQSSGRSSQDGMPPQLGVAPPMPGPAYQKMPGGASQAPTAGPSPFGNYAPLPQPQGWGAAGAHGSIYHWDSASSIETASSMASQGSRSLSSGLYGGALTPQPSPMSSQNLGPRRSSGAFGPPPGYSSAAPSPMNTSFTGSDYSETSHFQGTNFGLGSGNALEQQHPQQARTAPWEAGRSLSRELSQQGTANPQQQGVPGPYSSAPAQMQPINGLGNFATGPSTAPPAMRFPKVDASGTPDAEPSRPPPSMHFPHVDASGF